MLPASPTPPTPQGLSLASAQHPPAWEHPPESTCRPQAGEQRGQDEPGVEGWRGVRSDSQKREHLEMGAWGDGGRGQTGKHAWVLLGPRWMGVVQEQPQVVCERGGHWSIGCWENLAAGRWILTSAADTCNRGRRLSWGEGHYGGLREAEKSPGPDSEEPQAQHTHRKVSEGRIDIKEGSRTQGHPGHIPRRRKVSSRAVRSLSRSSTAQATQPLDVTR